VVNPVDKPAYDAKVNPTQQQRETAKSHAVAARKGFLFGGLLHDCLGVILNVEHGCVQQMINFAKQYARENPDSCMGTI